MRERTTSTFLLFPRSSISLLLGRDVRNKTCTTSPYTLAPVTAPGFFFLHRDRWFLSRCDSEISAMERDNSSQRTCRRNGAPRDIEARDPLMHPRISAGSCSYRSCTCPQIQNCVPTRTRSFFYVCCNTQSRPQENSEPCARKIRIASRR